MTLEGCAHEEVRLAVRRELEQPIVVELDVDDNLRINVVRSRHVVHGVLVGVGNLERDRPLENPRISVHRFQRCGHRLDGDSGHRVVLES